MLGREVVERQQLVLVISDLLNGLGKLRAVELGKRLDRRLGVVAVLGVIDVLDGLLRARLRRLRHGVEDIGRFVNPAPLLAGSGEDLGQGLPEAQSSVADCEDRGAHATASTVAQQVGPRLARLAVAVLERDQFLGAVGADPDEHQDAGFGLLQADVEVDAVGPHVHVVDFRQIAVHERRVVGLPLLCKPGDRGRGEPGRTAEELLQGRTKSPEDSPCR